jgi:thiol-disulfide isomerase/thioredoxin
MRGAGIPARRCIIVLFAAVASFGGTGFECGTPAEVRRFLREMRLKKALTPAQARQELERQVARHPRVFELRDAYLRQLRFSDRSLWLARRTEMLREAETRPRDPLALTVAAMTLHREDTPRAIQLLEQAQAAEPGDPISALLLAQIYHSGRFKDPEKARSFFEIYAEGCPGFLEWPADLIISRAASQETQARMARALRQRLERSAEPEDMPSYETLWSLEFRTRPPAEHAAVRQQVAADVERIEKLFPSPDARILEVLQRGAKQAGLPKEETEKINERIRRVAPRSYAAYQLAWEDWRQRHKEPESHEDAEAWKQWKRAYYAALSEWKDQYPEQNFLEDDWLSLGAELKLLVEKQVMARLARRIEEKKRRQDFLLWTSLTAATIVLDNQWNAARTLPWMARAWGEAVRLDEFEQDDTLTDQDRRRRLESGGFRGQVASVWLRAAQAAGERGVPRSLREWVERPAPSNPDLLSRHYTLRARLAAIEGRRADALAFFQQALLARGKPPGMYRGRRIDPLFDDAKAYFVSSGGSEEAFALWSAPRKSKVEERTGGRWETPEKELPAFELSDMQGRTWRLKDLAGKAVLINVWATWCGPCRAELPLLQKLYEQTKDRTDLQVITFNIDEQAGLVAPYLKENGYTFPVLLAHDLVHQMLDTVGIPQNWIVDAKGRWVAAQLGFDTAEQDWVNTMLKKLEAAARPGGQ